MGGITLIGASVAASVTRKDRRKAPQKVSPSMTKIPHLSWDFPEELRSNSGLLLVASSIRSIASVRNIDLFAIGCSAVKGLAAKAVDPLDRAGNG